MATHLTLYRIKLPTTDNELSNSKMLVVLRLRKTHIQSL